MTLKEETKKFSVERIANLFFLLVTLAGIYTSIAMNFVNRSLGIDEAALAYSFSTRSFWRLWDGAFKLDQSAPLGWLYMEKILAELFGNTEFVLRWGSIAGFILTLVLLYYLLKSCLKVRYPLAACAFIANIPFVLMYANTFKPYIWDGAFVFAAIALFWMYERGRVGCAGLTLGWAVLLWFSNPVAFFEGGLLLVQGLSAARRRKWNKVREVFFIGAGIGLSFIIYYSFWLRAVAHSEGMQSFWSGEIFPLFPTSARDLVKMLKLTGRIFWNFGTARYVWPLGIIFVFSMMISTLVLAFIHQNKLLIGCYMGILLALFASFIKMFPMAERLWCFLYPLGTLLCFYGLDRLLYGKGKTLLLVLALMVFLNQGIPYYLEDEHVYWKSAEVNSEIEYLERNIAEGDAVFVDNFSVPAYQFKKGYGNHSLGGYEDNVIFLAPTVFPVWERFDWDRAIAEIMANDRVYIVCSNNLAETRGRFLRLLDALRDKGILGALAEGNFGGFYDYTDGIAGRLRPLLDAASEKGEFQLQLVSYEHETPLFFFCRSLSDSKAHVSYEVLERTENGDRASVVLRIHNDGKSYLNHQCETLALVQRGGGGDGALPLPRKFIKPGESVDVQFEYDKGSPPRYRLENEYGPICEGAEIQL